MSAQLRRVGVRMVCCVTDGVVAASIAALRVVGWIGVWLLDDEFCEVMGIVGEGEVKEI